MLRLHACVVMCVIGVGCTNDAPPPPEVVPVARAPVEKAPIATPPRHDVDRSLGDGLEMRRPIRDGRIALIPIVATLPTTAREYLTLADGMARGFVRVREVGRNSAFSVDHLVLDNTSDRPLLALAGELVIEGLQDRVVARDVVVLPHANTRIEVRCVERGREYGELLFKPGQVMAELAVRERVVHANQQTVWETVAAINQQLGLSPPTGTYRGAAERMRADGGEAAERRDRLLAGLLMVEERLHVVGFAVAIDDKLVGVERFATPELYRALERELVASYSVGITGTLPHEAHALEPADVRAFLAGTGGKTTEASTVVLLAL
jgi:ARG/rhodanese/phosphatase superfamily protein